MYKYIHTLVQLGFASLDDSTGKSEAHNLNRAKGARVGGKAKGATAEALQTSNGVMGDVWRRGAAMCSCHWCRRPIAMRMLPCDGMTSKGPSMLATALPRRDISQCCVTVCGTEVVRFTLFSCESSKSLSSLLLLLFSLLDLLCLQFHNQRHARSDSDPS